MRFLKIGVGSLSGWKKELLSWHQWDLNLGPGGTEGRKEGRIAGALDHLATDTYIVKEY